MSRIWNEKEWTEPKLEWAEFEMSQKKIYICRMSQKRNEPKIEWARNGMNQNWNKQDLEWAWNEMSRIWNEQEMEWVGFIKIGD